jgi:hypothetical protein
LYYTGHGCLLVDESELLFLMFHWYVTKAVRWLAKRVLAGNDNTSTNDQLLQWCSCNFTGEEKFLEGITKLNNNVINRVDYISYVLGMPLMSDLFCMYSMMNHWKVSSIM